MPRFKEGDKVVITRGGNKYKTGVVTNPGSRVEGSEDITVEIMLDDDGAPDAVRGFTYQPEKHVEISPEGDPYEYSLQSTKEGTVLPIGPENWMTHWEVEQWLANCSPKRMALYKVTLKMVKRRKAGPIEDV